MPTQQCSFYPAGVGGSRTEGDHSVQHIKMHPTLDLNFPLSPRGRTALATAGLAGKARWENANKIPITFLLSFAFIYTFFRAPPPPSDLLGLGRRKLAVCVCVWPIMCEIFCWDKGRSCRTSCGFRIIVGIRPVGATTQGTDWPCKSDARKLYFRRGGK